MVPVNYFYRSFSRDELIMFYRAADIAVVTPLKDGMNLVAKEFCVSRWDQTGVLIQRIRWSSRGVEMRGASRQPA
jgi:trehalose-6-phosphate synthase